MARPDLVIVDEATAPSLIVKLAIIGLGRMGAGMAERLRRARADGVEEAWRIVDPALRDPSPVLPYAPGSWGPDAADRLIAHDGGWLCPGVDSDVRERA